MLKPGGLEKVEHRLHTKTHILYTYVFLPFLWSGCLTVARDLPTRVRV